MCSVGVCFFITFLTGRRDESSTATEFTVVSEESENLGELRFMDGASHLTFKNMPSGEEVFSLTTEKLTNFEAGSHTDIKSMLNIQSNHRFASK